ncbi:MAG: flagellar basal body L-ring protein FlgH [Planctomycetota bacterium]|nr:flagellar basal body L-ring protein FlgH [Planctomycetota bacterium]
MFDQTVRMKLVATGIAIGSLALAIGWQSPAWAQSSSLYQRDQQGHISLPSSSLTYRETAPPREIKLNDLVSVIVIESSQLISEGEFTGRKNLNLIASLREWFEFDGLNVTTAPLANGEPTAAGIYNSQFRANGELETRDALKFNLTARVVDIRPNGNLVIEARKRIQLDDEVWENSLTGIVRREDVDPRNRVTSDNIAELSINRRTVGHVRDSYRRGWFNGFYDKWSPF